MAKSDKKIFDAAVELFAKNGYEQTLTSQIAQKAGVSEATLFRRYNGKDAILKEIFRYTWEEMNKGFQTFTLSSPNRIDSLVNLYSYFGKFLVEDYPSLGRIFVLEGRVSSSRNEPITSESGQFHQYIESIISTGQKEGLFKKDLNVHCVCQMLMSFSEGLVFGLLWHKSHPHITSFEYTFQESVDMAREVINGLTAKSEVIGDTEKLKIFNIKLEAKRYQLEKTNFEDESFWKKNLILYVKNAQKIILEYDAYKYSLATEFFGN